MATSIEGKSLHEVRTQMKEAREEVAKLKRVITARHFPDACTPGRSHPAESPRTVPFAAWRASASCLAEGGALRSRIRPA